VQFVLVHGGWQGGWCWDAVAAILRDAGHGVFAPTLRGSEDGEVNRAGVDLTAIGEGLVDAISRADLRDLVLVGHSGGGPAIQHAAGQLASTTRRVVLVDAWVLRDGESIHDVLPAPLPEMDRAAAARSADRTVRMDPAVWASNFMNGASDEQIAATARRLVPVPLGWLTERISLPGFWAAGLPSSYVFCRDDRGAPLEVYAEMARRLGDPRTVECAGPHEPMLTHAEAMAEALLSAAKD
jgi:pimeloyl-ACP methyl ester carboxylesterase